MTCDVVARRCDLLLGWLRRRRRLRGNRGRSRCYTGVLRSDACECKPATNKLISHKFLHLSRKLSLSHTHARIH